MSASPTDPAAALAALNALLVAVQQTQIVNYIEVSAVAWLLYDMCLTFGRELKLIWKSKWSFVKVLYILSRYYGASYLAVTTAVSLTPGSKLSVNFCRHYYWYFCMGGEVIFTTLVNVILVLRLCALFRYKQKVMVALIGLLTVEFAFELWVSEEVSKDLWTHAGVAPPGIPITGCIAAPTRKNFQYASWVPCLVLAAIFFVMTMFQAYRTASSLTIRDFDTSTSTSPKKMGLKAMKESFSKLSPFKLIYAIVRDGVIYYFIITVVLLVSTITTQGISGAYASIALPWLIAIYSFAGTRLILNLREAAIAQNSTATWRETVELDTFRARAPTTVQFHNSDTDGSDTYDGSRTWH